MTTLEKFREYRKQQLGVCVNADEILDLVEKDLVEYETTKIATIEDLEKSREMQETKKKLKALDIIVKKQVNIGDFIRCKSVREYNEYLCYRNKEMLTKSEFDLLKEVCRND